MRSLHQRKVPTRTTEERLFAEFLDRQPIPIHQSKYRPPRFTEADIPAVKKALARIITVTKQNKSFFKDELKALARLERRLPQFIKLGVRWRKTVTTSRRGRPLKNGRAYFLMAALVPYAFATKRQGAWAWVDQELSLLGAGIDRPNELWNRTVKPRMGDTKFRDWKFDTMMSAASCAYVVFSRSRQLKLRPGSPLVGSQLRKLCDDDFLTQTERAVLTKAAELMPALIRFSPPDQTHLELYDATQISWVA